MAGSLKIVQFYTNEMGTTEDFGAIAFQSVSNMAAFHTTVHSILSGQGIQVINGLRVEAQASPGPAVRFKAGVGVDQLNLNLIEVLADQTLNIISGAENKAGGIWGTGAAADATNPRKTVIGVKATYIDTDPSARTYYDTVAKNTYNSTVNTRKQNDYDIVVVHGAAAVAPVEPVLTAGYTKLAVITVPATANVISDGNITRTRPVVRNFAPGQVVQLVGDGPATDTVWEAKNRAGTTLFSIKDDGTISLTTTYDGRYVLLTDKGANNGVATLTAQGKVAQDVLTVGGKAPGTAAGTLVYSDVNNKLTYSITGDAATVAGKVPGTVAGTLVYSDLNNKLPYSITGDAPTVGGKTPGAAAGNLVYSDVNNKLAYSITGDAATVAGKVPGAAAGNLVYSDVNNKLAYSITGDAATVAGKVPGAAAGNLAILDANLRVTDAAKLLGYVTNTAAVAGTIPVRDANGNIAGSVVGDAASVAGKVPGTAAGNLVYSDANNKLAYSITGDAATVGGYAPVATATASKIALRDAQGKLAGDILGNAAGAAKWTTGHTISLTGDAAGTSGAFDGTADLSFAVSLAASGAVAGTYRSVTVDTKGRVTGGTNPTTLAGYAISDALAASEAVAAPAANKLLRLDANSLLPASITGNAAGAAKWTTGHTISLTGDAAGTSGAFDGTADLSFALTLAASGAAAGTYTKVTVDTKGRVTAGATATAGDVGALATTEAVAAPAANKLLRLDANNKLPASITGDAATVGGNLPSAFEIPSGAQTKADTATEESLVVESANPVVGSAPLQVHTSMGPAIEFADAVSQSMEFNRRWPFTGNVRMEIAAAMDTSFAGNIRLQVGWQVNGGAVTNVAVTVTTLASTTALVIVDLGQIIAQASVPQGAIVTFTVSRLGADAADTHTGKLHIHHTRLKKG